MKKVIISVDGYSSSGKSTMAKALARRLGYRYIDSGAMYRAVTLAAMRAGVISDSGSVDRDALLGLLPSIDIDFKVLSDNRQVTILNGENVENDIRGMAVSGKVSIIAAIPEVRHAMVAMQKAFGNTKGIVMDGRDIGTTVFPDAEIKLFVNAPAQTRAERRFKELCNKGVQTTFDEVLKNIIERDHLDETREESPLRRATDAIDIDNSGMTIEEQDRYIDRIVSDKLMSLENQNGEERV